MDILVAVMSRYSSTFGGGGLGLLALVICSVVFIAAAVKRRSREAGAPEPSRGLPIIGHLHLLITDESKPFAQTLGDMGDKCGSGVFMLRLGMHPTLVVNSWGAAKDCLTTNDKALASRPTNAAGKHLGYGYAMIGFAPFGSYWRSIRKIAAHELLSNARIEMFKHVRSSEVDVCMKDLYAASSCNSRGTAVDMKQWLGDLSYNVVVSVVAGKRYFGSGGGSDEAWRFRRAVGELFRLLGAFVPSDMFPFLQWFDLSGHERAMNSAARELDSVMSGLLQEHRLKRRRSSSSSSSSSGDHRDFMDVMLSILEADAELSGSFDPDTVIKATSLALILGGSDTTSVSMIWTVAALLNNRQALKRVQEELDAQVGRERIVEESDVKKLVYLQAVVKESFRLYPASPLLVPHEAIEDCSVGGYHVPRGTRVLVNVWKLQRDPSVWGSDVLEFKPERFLPGSSHAGVDVRGQHLELIPFGAGRRACPGISFSLQVMHLTLARLFQGFDLDTPGNVPVNMCAGLGSTAAKSAPLQVLLTPRLAPTLYL